MRRAADVCLYLLKDVKIRVKTLKIIGSPVDRLMLYSGAVFSIAAVEYAAAGERRFH